jgi:hypothetical protein
MAFDGSSAPYYRDQAERIREFATTCKSADIRDQLERIAVQFEHLAHQVERGTVPL